MEEEAGGLEGPIAHPREAAGLEVAPELDADEKKAAGLYGFCSRVEGVCKGHGPYTGQEQYIGERHISHAIGITSGSGLPSSASMTSCI